ncbi:MAG: DUF4366 domain-containing protein [Lachnospiraceae bacterium]|nr:DUF4366 domain-containing protein [Lachnospiraceae bacterium]
MKKLIKTGITVVLAVGMLSMSIPTVAFAEEVYDAADVADIDPNDLISEDELPEDADIWEEDAEDEEIRVYRYDEDGNLVEVDPVFEDPREEPVSEDPKEKEDSEELEDTEQFGPLTPDGNMDLIDDYGSPSQAGKQFITVQTKGGQYFYIIIDRDDSGNETVHFLNQVDVADLLAYMEEEENTAYEERKAALEEKKAALAAEEEALKESDAGRPTPSEAEVKPDNPDKADPVKLPNSSVLIVVVIVIVGIGGAFYMKVIKKKQKTTVSDTTEMDPDDWDDDDDDTEMADVPDKREDESDE